MDPHATCNTQCTSKRKHGLNKRDKRLVYSIMANLFSENHYYAPP